ncbi:MAG: hypothetical protein IKS80_07280, partial [Bacteroidaceae bacterium]|nr:hypothetical protein [Bacteroidaceae bacterium]
VFLFSAHDDSVYPSFLVQGISKLTVRLLLYPTLHEHVASATGIPEPHNAKAGPLLYYFVCMGNFSKITRFFEERRKKLPSF